MAIHKLTSRFCETVKKNGMYADGGGLYLQVTNNGEGKSWLFRYHVQGRGDRQMGLGSFYTFPLTEAREKAEQCRKMRHNGIDPIESREAERRATKLAEAKNKTFADCAREFLEQKRNLDSFRQIERLVNTYLLLDDDDERPANRPTDDPPPPSALATLPVNMVGIHQVRDVLKPLFLTKPSTAMKVQQHLCGILDLAITLEYRMGPNPAAWTKSLKSVLPDVSNREIKSCISLPYAQIGMFVKGVRAYRPLDIRGVRLLDGECLNGLLLCFIIFTAVRTKEARLMVWKELNSDMTVWTVPPERTKVGRRQQGKKAPHVVHLNALARRILKIMKARQAADGIVSDYVFTYGKEEALRTGQAKFGKPITGETTLIHFLQDTLPRKGLTFDRNDLTVHGFRSTFKSWQIDHFPGLEVIGEMALDHKVGTEVREIYARDAKAIKQFRRLMEAWGAACCGGSKPFGKNVIPMRGRGKPLGPKVVPMRGRGKPLGPKVVPMRAAKRA
jgi:integrase